jgi:hypothetical protein
VILTVQRGRRPGTAALVIGAGLAASALYAVARYFDFGPALACPWAAGVGVRCPGCGTTAMLGHLLHGQPGAALAANPLFAALYLTGTLIVLNGLVGLVLGRSLALRLSSTQQWIGLVLFLAALAINWAYVLTR